MPVPTEVPSPTSLRAEDEAKGLWDRRICVGRDEYIHAKIGHQQNNRSVFKLVERNKFELSSIERNTVLA